MSTSADDHKYKRIASYPRFPVKFKSKRWTCKIARKVLKDILKVEGFGSGSKKCYGRARDEPDSWPDTISWASFKGPSFAKLETCNEIIECLLQNRQIDVNSYHLENEEVDEAERGDPQSSCVDEGVDDDGDNPFLATVRTFTM